MADSVAQDPSHPCDRDPFGAFSPAPPCAAPVPPGRPTDLSPDPAPAPVAPSLIPDPPYPPSLLASTPYYKSQRPVVDSTAAKPPPAAASTLLPHAEKALHNPEDDRRRAAIKAVFGLVCDQCDADCVLEEFAALAGALQGLPHTMGASAAVFQHLGRDSVGAAAGSSAGPWGVEQEELASFMMGLMQEPSMPPQPCLLEIGGNRSDLHASYRALCTAHTGHPFLTCSWQPLGCCSDGLLLFAPCFSPPLAQV